MRFGKALAFNLEQDVNIDEAELDFDGFKYPREDDWVYTYHILPRYAEDPNATEDESSDTAAARGVGPAQMVD